MRGRRGKFEHAEGGTLFLDEVADLSLTAQAKLLRALQDLSIERVGGNGVRRVNTRIVAATNQPLGALVARGLFRADLYYRLSGVEIEVAPLRQRRGDIPELAITSWRAIGTCASCSCRFAAEDALCTYDWPGNVRELERLMERFDRARRHRPDRDRGLPEAVRGTYAGVLAVSAADDESMRAWGSRYARLVFERCRYNKRRACRILDISYHTLQSYLTHGRVRPPRRPARLAPFDEASPDDPASRAD